MYKGFTITTAGEWALARASAGEAMKITKVQVGKGAADSQAAAKALTALIDPVADATSTAPVVNASQLSMIAEYRNDLNGGLETGFDLAEFGIFAQVGDDEPTLVYYACLGDKPQPVQPESDGLDIVRFPVAIIVTGSPTVTLNYPAAAFITASQIGVPNGVASLGSDGKVPETQLPDTGAAPSVVEFTKAEWSGGKLTIPQKRHGRSSGSFWYVLRHKVNGQLKGNTWAVHCTDVAYDADGKTITLACGDAYDGQITFYSE